MVNTKVMELEKTRIHIENIIKETFDIINKIYNTNQESAVGNFGGERHHV